MFFSLSDRYKIYTSNWLWIEILNEVGRQKGAELHLEEFLNFILKKAVPRILLYLFLTSFARCWRCSVEFAAKTAIELEASLNPDINHTSSWMQENKNEKSKDYCKADLKQRVLRKQAISENEQDGICYL